jgi:hypothetical protein
MYEKGIYFMVIQLTEMLYPQFLRLRWYLAQKGKNSFRAIRMARNVRIVFFFSLDLVYG